jgi:ParB-like chromosome segregation protein Spo0J
MTPDGTIEHRALDSLTPDPDNARTRGPQAIEAIANSLEAFGQQKPIVVDRSGVVLAGNGALAAAKTLGWETIACRVTDLAGPGARAYAVADNRTAELSHWRSPQLLASLQAAEQGDLLDALGFEPADLDRLRREVDGDEPGAELGDLVQQAGGEVAAAPVAMRSLVIPFPEGLYEVVAQELEDARDRCGSDSYSETIIQLLQDPLPAP